MALAWERETHTVLIPGNLQFVIIFFPRVKAQLGARPFEPVSIINKAVTASVRLIIIDD